MMIKKRIYLLTAAATIIISLMGFSHNSVQAAGYNAKVVGKGSYGIYANLGKHGPSGYMGNTGALRYSNFQSGTTRQSGRSRYCYVYINGHKAGWVNENAFEKNKISVAKNVSLVYNPNYTYNTRDALNYATDVHGNAIDIRKVHVNRPSISSNDIGTHIIKYSYGKAHATSKVIVRGNKKEGIAKANAKPQKSRSYTTWKTHYKTSGNWGNSFAPETTDHTLKSGGLTLKTVFYQPATLNVDGSVEGSTGPTPEGLAVSQNRMYLAMYKHVYYNHARIISYDLNGIPKYELQKLPWLPWNEFYNLSKSIKFSPYIKMGHGQTFSATEKYLYVIANNHLLTNSSKSEEIMRINKNNLQIDKIWTFKIWNGDANHPRYIHNAVFVNDHEFYAVFHNSAMKRFEYWRVTRHGNEWHPKEVGASGSNFMRNGSPVQGFTYDKRKNQFYLAFNDYILNIAKNGKLLRTSHFNSGREIEGISATNHDLYVELAERPELFRGWIK